MSHNSEKTRRLVGLSIFTALVVVLQLVATFVRIGTFPLNLTLIPIVVGAAVYGQVAGAWLGGVFGVVVVIACITGADAGGAILWNVNPLVTGFLCILKGAMAGWVAALVYSVVNRRKDDDREGKDKTVLGVILAAIASPLTNTGIFCLGMVVFFRDTLTAWAGGADVVYYILVGLVGINFLIEMAINIVLSPAVVRIIKARTGRRV